MFVISMISYAAPTTLHLRVNLMMFIYNANVDP